MEVLYTMGHEPYETDFSHTQQVALAIIPKFTSFLSIVGSGWIILEVSRDRRKLGLVYHRMMLEMSCGDVVDSVCEFLSTWPMPEGTPNVYGAVGTTATCTAQGFFKQFGLTAQLLQVFLSAYFVAVLRYNWKESRLIKLEVVGFSFCFLLGLGTAIAGLPLTLFNASNFWCWIAAFPTGCQDDPRAGNEASCTRGYNAWIYRLAFGYVWSWLGLLLVVVLMGFMYCTVHQQVKRLKRYSSGGEFLEKKRAQVGVQAMAYIGSYIAVTLFATMERVSQLATGKTNYTLALLMVTFNPLRGFFNGLIYLHPRYRSYKGAHPSWTVRKRIKRVLLRALRSPSKKETDEEIDDEDYKLGNVELD